MIRKILVLFAVLMSFGPNSLKAQGSDNEWHGLRPLHSSKAQVEKLLSKPKNAHLGLYETDTEVITFWFSSGRCNKKNLWNVPEGTVIGILVSPKNFVNARPIINRFKQEVQMVPDAETPGIFTYYSDDSSVKFQAKILANGDEELMFIAYAPSKSDDALRCK
jgi:hypothetical protein